MTGRPSLASRRAHGALVLVAALFVVSSGVAVQAKPPPTLQAASERRQDTAEESKRLGDEAQRAAEARQAIWDRKMRSISGSICTGC
jgi:hypothetical protein